MNKPAAKEPSMDEILSSIRQIIADEDQTPSRPNAAAQPEEAPGQSEEAPGQTESRSAEPAQAEAPVQAAEPEPAEPVEETPEPVRPEPAPEPETTTLEPGPAPEPAPEPEEEPLALSPEQLVSDEDPAPAETTEDVGWPGFNPDPANTAGQPEAGDLSAALHEAAALRETETPAETAAEHAPAEAEAEPGIVLPDDIAFGDEQPRAAAEPELQPATASTASAARDDTARMPDENLSSDMAEKLLEPTTSAATRHAFSRLNSLSIGTEGVTLESMVREMLRPMLKEWLDENLPSVVERMVEREIERISRGG